MRPGPGPGRSRPPQEIESQLRAIERDGGDGEVVFGGGASLRLSNLGKVYFPDIGLTKGALMRYYAHLWPVLAPHVADRPLVLKRFPEGVGGPVFYQQNAAAKVPSAVRVETVETSEGKRPRIVGGDLQTLLYTVQLGCIEVHPWLSRVGDLESADRCLIDLDPGDDVPFSNAVKVAKDLLQLATECALPMAIKTSGANGIHLVIPLPPRTSYATSSRLAMLLARAAVTQRPDLATVERSIRARPAGTTYVDALQNARGKSMASAYSVRPQPDGTVSMPITPAELTGRLATAKFSVRSAAARVMRKGDLWGNALKRAPTTGTITRAMRALEQVLDDATEAASGGGQQRSGGRSVRHDAGRERHR